MARQTQTRDRLIRTAAELFWRRGYAHTGVSVIMKRARATSGSFYHFFSTKDDLLLAVIDTVGDLVETDVLDAAEAASAEADGRIAFMATAYRRHSILDGGGFGLPLGAFVHELGPELDEARRGVATIYERMVQRIVAWLEADSCASGDELLALAEGVVSDLEGAALMAVATRDLELLEGAGVRVSRRVTEVQGVSSQGGDELPPPVDADIRDWKAW